MKLKTHSPFLDGVRAGFVDTWRLLCAVHLAPFRVLRDYIVQEGEFAPRPNERRRS